MAQHYTDATDTRALAVSRDVFLPLLVLSCNIANLPPCQFVISAVSDVIIQVNLRDAGLL